MFTKYAPCHPFSMSPTRRSDAGVNIAQECLATFIFVRYMNEYQAIHQDHGHSCRRQLHDDMFSDL